MDIVSENTAITIPIFISFIGFAYWLTTLYSLSKRNRDDIEAIKKEINSINNIKEDIASMKTKLDIIYEMVLNGPIKTK